jgi:hypothetical protein
MGDVPPLFIDSDVDTFARDFLDSPYAGEIYADWSLDRRLHAFLRRQGADDGDLCNLVLDRIMANRAVTTGAGSQTAR